MNKWLLMALTTIVGTIAVVLVYQGGRSSEGLSGNEKPQYRSNPEIRQAKLETEAQRKNKEREKNPIKSFTNLPQLGLSTDELAMERQRLMRLIAETEGFDVAIRLLNEQVGDGAIRRGLLHEIFIGLKESITISLQRLDDMPSDDRRIAVRSLVERIFYQNLPDSEMAILFSSKQAKEAGGFAQAMTISFMNAKEAEIGPMFDRIGMVMKQLPAEDRSDFLATALRAAAKGFYPFEVWNYLSSLDTSSFDESEEMIRSKNSIIESMIARDGPRALEIIHNDKRLPPNAFQDAISDLYLRDSRNAEVWVEQHAGSFTDFQKDQIASARIDSMLRADKLNEAEKAIEEIKDADLKDEANSNIFKIEKKKLLDLVKTDPSGAMGQLMNTESSRNALLIMEGMSAWIAQDPVQASEWYSDHWNSLPAGNVQFVAAAYVKESLAQGDIARAKEWVSHISDETLREVFEGEISKAANK